MSIVISFIGLNRFSLSMGMALEKEKKNFERRAFDTDRGIVKAAKKAGAIDKPANSIPAAVKGAQVVVIDYPADLLEFFYEQIGVNIEPNTILIDTSPVKDQVDAYAEKYIPESVSLVSMNAGINPEFLDEFKWGSESARAGLFENATIAISNFNTKHPDGVQFAAQLCNLLGATPYFSSSYEIQGMLTYTHMLPQLAAAALMTTGANQASWLDGQRFGNDDFFQVTAPLFAIDEIEHPGAALRMNRENVLRLINSFISEMEYLRDLFSEEDAKAFEKYLRDAHKFRREWVHHRHQNVYEAELESGPEFPAGDNMFRQMFLGGIGRRRVED
ncbi:MAG: prephenate dehydrogenase, partial [Anaerolineaceae bacterium]|nr:prephenate dehydrogenase [Anaerolineaceae bacterium]